MTLHAFVDELFRMLEDVHAEYQLRPHQRNVAGIRNMFDSVFEEGFKRGAYPEGDDLKLRSDEMEQLQLGGRCEQCGHLAGFHVNEEYCAVGDCNCKPWHDRCATCGRFHSAGPCE